MRWRIARLFGIDIYMHGLFLLLPAYVAWVAWYDDTGLRGVFEQLGLVVMVFTIVVLHELGHALVAREFGIKTRDIVLLPIGGVARLERMPDTPGQELLVALAGPAVNFVLACLCFAVYLAHHLVTTRLHVALPGATVLFNLLLFNVILAVFNLLPAFPMDGGRVVRALLAMEIDFVWATRAAAWLGYAMGLLFVAGARVSWFLPLVGVFVWFGATQEVHVARMRALMRSISVSAVMSLEFPFLTPDLPLDVALAWLRDYTQDGFPVLVEGRLVGLLVRGDLQGLTPPECQRLRVADYMRRGFTVAEVNESLDAVAQRLQADPGPAVPVLQDGALVGLIWLDEAAAELRRLTPRGPLQQWLGSLFARWRRR